MEFSPDGLLCFTQLHLSHIWVMWLGITQRLCLNILTQDTGIYV